LIDLTFKEMENFCANIINVKNDDNVLYAVMSETAFHSFSKKNLEILNKNYKILHVDINTIEIIGGGSARCMIGEMY